MHRAPAGAAAWVAPSCCSERAPPGGTVESALWEIAPGKLHPGPSILAWTIRGRSRDRVRAQKGKVAGYSRLFGVVGLGGLSPLLSDWSFTCRGNTRFPAGAAAFFAAVICYPSHVRRRIRLCWEATGAPDGPPTADGPDSRVRPFSFSATHSLRRSKRQIPGFGAEPQLPPAQPSFILSSCSLVRAEQQCGVERHAMHRHMPCRQR